MDVFPCDWRGCGATAEYENMPIGWSELYLTPIMDIPTARLCPEHVEKLLEILDQAEDES